MTEHELPYSEDAGDDPIAASRAIQRRTGRTFYLATRLFPRRVRRATHVLYAFFRLADDVVDENVDRPAAEKRAELRHLREVTLDAQPTSVPILEEFRRVRDRRDIPDEEVRLFLDAMETDVSKSRYETREELESYMRGSAAAVGNMMAAVMGVENFEGARPHAEALGEAFQLSNFLRDVREDVRDHGRIYLPRETLERHGAAERDVENLDPTPEFRRAMESELRWAEERYRVGVAGIDLLPRDCQFPVLLAAVYSAEYHRLIRRRDFDVLSRSPRLGTARMLALLARVRWHWARRDDPEAVFYAASAISREETDGSPTEPEEPAGRVRRPLRTIRRAAREYGR
jgi:phytoene synthase